MLFACLFTRHLHVPGFHDATRPHKGEVRGGGDYTYPSDPNSHVWVCNFDADVQTQAGIAALGGRVLGILSDSLGPIHEEVSIFGLGSEVE